MQQNALFQYVIPFLFMFGVFYFLVIKPQQKRQKEHEEMLKKINKNDEVVTGGGIHATVVNVKEKTFILRIDDNAKMEVDKSSIAYVKKSREE